MSKNISGLSAFNTKALEKLFEYIGERYNKDYVTKPAWYLTKSWTTQQQDSFSNWYVDELVMNHGVQRKTAERDACYFITHFGWKINDGVKSKP